MKETHRYSFNSHESLGEDYGLTVRGEKNSHIARGKAQVTPLEVDLEANTALSRPHSRAAKRATLQHTLSTPSNRAFPPKSTQKSTSKNPLRTTPRNIPKNTWKNRSEAPSPQPVYTITGSSSQRQRALQGSPTLTCAEWNE